MTQKRAFYSRLAPYYDFMVPPTTDLECMFLNNIFQEFGKDIAKVLDIACGTGRHSYPLSKMGYQMTGIDNSPDMIKVAKIKCPQVIFKNMDFYDLQFPQNFFDASFCMWSTISYIKTTRDFTRFIQGLAKVTKQLLIIDSSNYENPARNKPLIKGEKIIKLPKATIKSSMVRKYDEKTRFRIDEFTTVLSEAGKKPITLKEKEKVRLWSVKEMEDSLKSEFNILNVYGDYSLDKKYDPQTSERKIFVAQKKV